MAVENVIVEKPFLPGIAVKLISLADDARSVNNEFNYLVIQGPDFE
ncbi:MAG: hypothetical protein VXZ24_12850 [Pseudomonadota bacterium]|nr:hypothetical protein [Pseudomonadota bacterium]MEC8525116.1 hypothetical protein [Pseudomonadota bacterium]